MKINSETYASHFCQNSTEFLEVKSGVAPSPTDITRNVMARVGLG